MYKWALNKQKLARAVGMSGKDAKEELVKKNYLKIGGKVALEQLKEETKVDEKEPVESAPEVVEIPEVTSEVTATPAPEEVTTTSTE